MAKTLHEICKNLNQVAQKAHILNVIDAQQYADTAASMKRLIAEITSAVMQARRLNDNGRQGEELCETETGGDRAGYRRPRDPDGGKEGKAPPLLRRQAVPKERAGQGRGIDPGGSGVFQKHP